MTRGRPVVVVLAGARRPLALPRGRADRERRRRGYVHPLGDRTAR